jgi:hypothetical protein
VHIGQTGRNFITHCNEHRLDIKCNRDNSRFAKHIIDFQHEYGIIDETVEILKIMPKGKH